MEKGCGPQALETQPLHRVLSILRGEDKDVLFGSQVRVLRVLVPSRPLGFGEVDVDRRLCVLDD